MLEQRLISMFVLSYLKQGFSTDPPFAPIYASSIIMTQLHEKDLLTRYLPSNDLSLILLFFPRVLRRVSPNAPKVPDVNDHG
jgi:hypothetical protein